MSTLAVIGLSTSLLANPSSTKEVRIKLIETSDVHGIFFPYDFIVRKELGGGLPRVSSYMKEQRKEFGENCILFDNGDILQGQPSVYYYNFIDTLSTHLAADVMNYVGYDLGNIGNHDIETGSQVYNRWKEECNFPILSANTLHKESNSPYFKPYVLFEKEGVKIAILGMVTPAIPCWLPEQLWQGMRFEDMEASARYWVKIIEEQEKPDFLIGLFHAGKSGSYLGSIAENPSLEVAKRVPGFDAVFIGHDHELACMKITNEVGEKVLFLNPGYGANHVSTATLCASLKDGKVVKKTVVGENVEMSKYPIDADYMAHFEKQYKDSKEFVSKKIGHIDRTISTKEAYFGSSAFIDLTHQLQLEISGAEISLAAPLSFSSEIAEGDIFVSDMFNLYKYENMLYVMSISGKELKGLLEFSYAKWINQMTSPEDHMLLFKEPLTEEGKARLANANYNFDSAAGINYTVDVTKPVGERVKVLGMSNGEPFDESRYYRVAVNSFRGNGGGDLLVKGASIPSEELSGRIISSTEKDLRYYLIGHIEKLKNLSPVKNDNWRFIPEEWVIPAAKRDYKWLFGTDKP
ncbi:MAG: bifunctional metallophosphatase/5'-nucleotidase [Phocaeicola sp.]